MRLGYIYLLPPSMFHVKHSKSEMAKRLYTLLTFCLIIWICLSVSLCQPQAQDEDKLRRRQQTSGSYTPGKVLRSEIELLEFPLNLEYLEAEFFLWGALGYGLDRAAPELASGGPRPQGAKKANLDSVVGDVIEEFAYQEVGHLRAIKETVKGFPRPFLNLSAGTFAKTMDAAFNKSLDPPFDPYANSLNYLIASYVIPYVGLTGYVGTNPRLQSATAKRLVAGLLGVESGQDAVIRALLFERKNDTVKPYPYTVAEFTDRISSLRNSLGRTASVDEGLYVKKAEGAEGKVQGNVLAGDANSLSFARTPEEILRIVYASGNESHPGGFFPRGGDGKIVRRYLHK